MSERQIIGKAHAYGDDVDTDGLIPGKYTKTLDLGTLAMHALEDLDPSFQKRVRPGDILVAGANFGCGSSREQAPLALKAAGISAVVARSFARIFYRNAINIGLPVLEVDPFEIETNDELMIDLSTGAITNLTRNGRYTSKPLPSIMLDILNTGGLVNYLRKNGDYRLHGPRG
jgi:3-isopropylmalate dehydratase small subunit